MFRFEEGDAVVVTERDPLHRAGKAGYILWREADEELRDPCYTVLFVDGSRALLDEAWLDEGPIPEHLRDR